MSASRPASTRPAIRVSPPASESEWLDARRLTGELIAWLAEAVALDARTHQHDSNEELDSLRDFYQPPAGRFLVGYVGGVPAGTSGIYMMTPDTAELRRVWVTPGARGNGLAPALLEAAIATARELGARRIWLETAAGHMDTAIAMYRRAGFREVAPYSSLPETIPNILTLGLELE